MEELGLETTIGRQSESHIDHHGLTAEKVAGNSDEVNISTSEVEHVNSNEVFKFSNTPTLEDIRMVQQKFADDRHWNEYHKPRNLLLAMVGEVGELSEIFQWKGEVETGLPGIGQRKMRFAGHVLRGSSGELANLVLEGTIDGKRDRGKQRRTWSDDVKNWSRTGNLGKAKRKAKDKSWSGKDKEHLGQELSDVLLYLINLASKCHVDLPQEVLKKIELNKLKYPAQKVKGSSKKYDEYTKYNLN
ncbi:dCTP pyrophosphatase 1 [Nymphon striatum]|nr:dCTP pyrophosphatase 1 [Nymphon striatum]